MRFNKAPIDATWRPLIEQALMTLPSSYLQWLEHEKDWLPGPSRIFQAFSLPLHRVNYILLGESPYPRAESANGYAFWDAAVGEIWAEQGLSKSVNRATSLRNFIKMLLVAEGVLKGSQTMPSCIAALDKQAYVSTLGALFENMLDEGILLLNATLVLSSRKVTEEVKIWRPFMASLLQAVAQKKNNISLILLGTQAKSIREIAGCEKFRRITAEHPYNLSFIENIDVLNLFRPLRLLNKRF